MKKKAMLLMVPIFAIFIVIGLCIGYQIWTDEVPKTVDTGKDKNMEKSSTTIAKTTMIEVHPTEKNMYYQICHEEDALLEIKDKQSVLTEKGIEYRILLKNEELGVSKEVVVNENDYDIALLEKDVDGFMAKVADVHVYVKGDHTMARIMNFTVPTLPWEDEETNVTKALSGKEIREDLQNTDWGVEVKNYNKDTMKSLSFTKGDKK